MDKEHAFHGFSRDAIKYFAMFTMLINHIATVFVPSGAVKELLLDVGYFTAITMCFFLVEGYRYTRSRKKYGQRLLLFGVLSQAPYMLAMSVGYGFLFTGLNMMFTLFLCFLILEAREKICDPFRRRGVQFLLVMLSVFCDWALLAPIFTMMFASAFDSRKQMVRAYAAAALLFALFNFAGYTGQGWSAAAGIGLSLASCAGIVASGVVVLFLYNGKRAERGRTFSKWFFYMFYPVHLLLLGLLGLLR